MRFGLIIVLIGGAFGCATAHNYSDPAGPVFRGQAPPSIRAPRPLKLVTFNIKFGKHVDRAAELLSAPGPLQDADVLLLQEMDAQGTEEMARSLRMNYVYVPSAVHPASHRDIGVAVLSPWPIEDGRKLLLPHEHRTRKMVRAAAVATINLPAGAVRVYAVHLETALGASDRDRRDQADAVLDDAAQWRGPVVVAGDFNGRDAAREIAKAGFQWLTRRVHHTSWLFDFDHILVRGLCAVGDPAADKGSKVRGISDHRPVWTVVAPC